MAGHSLTVESVTSRIKNVASFYVGAPIADEIGLLYHYDECYVITIFH